MKKKVKILTTYSPQPSQLHIITVLRDYYLSYRPDRHETWNISIFDNTYMVDFSIADQQTYMVR